MKNKTVKENNMLDFSQDVVKKLISLLPSDKLVEFDTWFHMKYGDNTKMFVENVGLDCMVYHKDGICSKDNTSFTCCNIEVSEPKGSEVPPTLLDDMIPDWEHDNLVKNG